MYEVFQNGLTPAINQIASIIMEATVKYIHFLRILRQKYPTTKFRNINENKINYILKNYYIHKIVIVKHTWNRKN